MSERTADDRRRGDRRTRSDPNYSGSDRRGGPRRSADKEPRSKIGLIVGAVAVFIIADATMWDGRYRHAALSKFQTELSQVRDWSVHIWDMG